MSDSATTPAPDDSGPAQLPDVARPIAAGYAFTGPALDLGTRTRRYGCRCRC